MNVSEHDLQALLQRHLKDKLRQDARYSETKEQEATLRHGAGSRHLEGQRSNPRAPQDPEKEANRLQHRIYQLRDRLSHEIFGRDSESLADAFIARFDLPIEKRSPEYYQILRRVLRLEIEYHSALMERLSGNHSGS